MNGKYADYQPRSGSGTRTDQFMKLTQFCQVSTTNIKDQFAPRPPTAKETFNLVMQMQEPPELPNFNAP